MRYWLLLLLCEVILAEGRRKADYDNPLRQAEQPEAEEVPVESSISDTPSQDEPFISDTPSQDEPFISDMPSPDEPSTTDMVSSAESSLSDMPSSDEPSILDLILITESTTPDIPSPDEPSMIEVSSSDKPSMQDMPSTDEPSIPDMTSTDEPSNSDKAPPVESSIFEMPLTNESSILDIDMTTAQSPRPDMPSSDGPSISGIPSPEEPSISNIPPSVESFIPDIPLIVELSKSDISPDESSASPETTGDDIGSDILDKGTEPEVSDIQSPVEPSSPHIPLTVKPFISDIASSVAPPIPNIPSSVEVSIPVSSSIPTETTKKMGDYFGGRQNSRQDLSVLDAVFPIERDSLTPEEKLRAAVGKLIEEFLKKIQEFPPRIDVNENLLKFLTPGICELVGDDSLPLREKTPSSVAEIINSLPSSELAKLLLEHFNRQQQQQQQQQQLQQQQQQEQENQEQQEFQEYQKFEWLLKQQQLQEQENQKQQELQENPNLEGFVNRPSDIGTALEKPSAETGVLPPVALPSSISNEKQRPVNIFPNLSGLASLINFQQGAPHGILGSLNGGSILGLVKPDPQSGNRPIPISLASLTGIPISDTVSSDVDKVRVGETIEAQTEPVATVDELLTSLEFLLLPKLLHKKLEQYFRGQNDMSPSDRFNFIEYLENLDSEDGTRRNVDELKNDLTAFNIARNVAGRLADSLARRFRERDSNRGASRRKQIGGLGKLRDEVNRFKSERKKVNDRDDLRNPSDDYERDEIRRRRPTIPGHRTRTPRVETGNMNIIGFDTYKISGLTIRKSFFTGERITVRVDIGPLLLLPVGFAGDLPAVAKFLLQLSFGLDFRSPGGSKIILRVRDFESERLDANDIILSPCIDLGSSRLQKYASAIASEINNTRLKEYLEDVLDSLVRKDSILNLFKDLPKIN